MNYLVGFIIWWVVGAIINNVLWVWTWKYLTLGQLVGLSLSGLLFPIQILLFLEEKGKTIPIDLRKK